MIILMANGISTVCVHFQSPANQATYYLLVGISTLRKPNDKRMSYENYVLSTMNNVNL